MKLTSRSIFNVCLGFLILIIAFVVFYQPQNQSANYVIEETINLNFSLKTTKVASLDPVGIKVAIPTLKKTFLSKIYPSAEPFTALSLVWEKNTPPQTDVNLFVRFLSQGKWNNWQTVWPDEDDKYNMDENHKSALLITPDSKAFQYKAILTSKQENVTPYLKNIKFTYFNSKQKKSTASVISELIAGLSLTTENKPKIISRKKWGADESLRLYKGNIEEGKPLDFLHANEKEYYEKYARELQISKVVETNKDGQYYSWPQEYAKKIKKIVIHHTATTSNLDDPKEAIRNIYYYHAITKGWGDIGYNYIIDLQGNIYEGRAGGDKVVGAHAGTANNGSVGISVLGDYSLNEPPYPVIQSLLNLTSFLTKKYQIDPDGISKFREFRDDNILGHRDVMSTSCPGEMLYKKIPLVRKLISKNIVLSNISTDLTTEKFSYAEISDRNMIDIKVNQKKKINIILKNTGTESWTKDTYLKAFHSDEKSDSQDIIALRKKNEKKYKNVATLIEPEVKPGETGSFTVTIISLFKSGLTSFDLLPVFNGNIKATSFLTLPIYVDPPKMDFSVITASYPKGQFNVGDRITGFVELKNDSDLTWEKEGTNATRLGTVDPYDRISELSPEKSNRIATLVQTTVKPGAIGRFEFNLQAPNIPGKYTEKFAPIIENVAWLPDKGLTFTVSVIDKSLSAEFSESSWDKIFIPNEKKEIFIKIKNIGQAVWKTTGNNKFQVRVSGQRGIRVGKAVISEKEILPGGTATIKVKVTAPKKLGQYQVYFYPQVGTQKLFKSRLYFKFTVEKAKESDAEKKLGGKIRILLGFAGNPVIASTGNYAIYQNDEAIKELSKNESLEVTYKDDEYLVRNLNYAFLLKNPIRFVPLGDSILSINNWDRPYKKFRGVMEVQFFDKKLIVINELPLETYLRGLAEEPNDEPYEKIKALIILARTYAYYRRDVDPKFPDKPYDGSDDPAIYQKYRGYDYEITVPNVVKAVEETQGQIVTFEKKPALTPYFSRSDGRTRSAEEVFGWKDKPYLQSVPDPYCEGMELWGHGVGLSGCGSKEAAKRGKNYEEILKYYYQGIEITKWY